MPSLEMLYLLLFILAGSSSTTQPA